MNWADFRLSKRLILSSQMIEKLYTKIAQIDTVKNTYHLTNKLLPQTIDRLTQSVIVTSTGASNRIEGNRLTDEEVEALYKSMRIKLFASRDEQEVAGYMQTLERVFDFHKSMIVSESQLLQLHQNMLEYSVKDRRHKGQYKFGPNRVEAKDQSDNVVGIIFDPTPPHLTQKEIQELIDWYHWAQKTNFKHPLLLIANFIFEYLAIHPFQDGNGRTSRLLTNLMLLQNGYSFAQLVSHEKLIEKRKAEYFLALNKTQKYWKSQSEDMSAWLTFIFDIFHAQAMQAQSILTQDQFEYLLSEKQMIFWEWVQKQTIFSRKTVIEGLQFSPRTVEEIIRKFVGLKKLERLGEGRATRYRVLE